MKTNIMLIASLLMTIFLISSCEDYLDKTPDAIAFSDDDVFTSYEKSQQFVDALIIPGYFDPNPWQPEFYANAILNNLPQAMWGSRNQISDDCMYSTKLEWNFQKQIRVGNFYSSAFANYSWWSENHYKRFDNYWKGIRIANVSISNVERIKDIQSEQRGNILGLAYFMKGHFYFQLLQAWGGMPWFEKPMSPYDEMDVKRETYQVTAQKIAETFDSAAKYLPLIVDPTLFPRPSKIAAMVYKAKALTWAASPFSNPEGNQKLWEDAAVAGAQAIMEAEGSNYYQLVDLSNWKKMFVEVNEEAFKEVLYGILVKNRNWVGGHEDFQYCGINSVAFGSGVSAESPTENLAQCFPWNNNEPVNPESVEYKTNPFYGDGTSHTGRDPRFYETFVFNGQKNPITLKEGRNVEIWNESYDNKTASELKVNTQFEPLPGHTTTGYYIWKLFPEPHIVSQARANLMYHYIRLADVYLFYAEAANRAWGPKGSPKGVSGFTYSSADALNKIRLRAGMPPYDDSTPWLSIGDAENFEKHIRNEYRIETAFEGKRFYDIRRWNLVTNPAVLLQKGLYIKKTGPEKFEYNVFQLRDAYQLRWQGHHALFPIDPKNTYLGPAFTQNPGW